MGDPPDEIFFYCRSHWYKHQLDIGLLSNVVNVTSYLPVLQLEIS